MSQGAYAILESRLGYAFLRQGLLEEALTHRSFLNENPVAGRGHNERLEFLGDALLGLLVGQWLMELMPESSEGELSKARARVVDEPTLARTAVAIDLGEWLFLGRGEEQTGGRKKPSILADACEALIAAVYLDGGFAAAQELVRHLFAEQAVEVSRSSTGTDFKTRLQERSQAQLKVQPRYAVVTESGPPHDRRFEVALLLGDVEYSRGEGRSKKEAEQRAAEAGLEKLAAAPT